MEPRSSSCWSRLYLWALCLGLLVSAALAPGVAAEETASEKTASKGAVTEGALPQYEVFPQPLTSPDDGPRSIQVMPDDPIASPFGWHDVDGVLGPEFNITRGNNVHVYGDRDANNMPDPGSEPSSVDLDFTGDLVPLDLTLDPVNYLHASVVNQFYWTNLSHDLLYHYGFDEQAGNFQEYNYTTQSTGGDAVNVEAQKGADLNFSNIGSFSTPPDGSPPRMLLGVWTFTDPFRDSGLSNLVVVHEYVHGLTSRLTAGPSNVNCVGNEESLIEGWSDWYALAFTAETTDTAAVPRGLGNYLLGEPPDGAGFRPAPYSPDFAINDATYSDIITAPSFHNVGFVWGTMLWDAYWNLVEAHGFNPDLFGSWDTGGNNLALQLVTDALKLQPCNPGFVDGRNAILLADQVLTGGQNQCLLWDAFARRGLGVSAVQGSPHSTLDNVEAFDLPEICQPGDLFLDGFESGDVAAWSSAVGI